MLTILGREEQKPTTCDGLSRRGFLQIGAMGFGGIALPQLLRAEAAAGILKSHKAVINILLPGGPPHLDLFDRGRLLQHVIYMAAVESVLREHFGPQARVERFTFLFPGARTHGRAEHNLSGKCRLKKV